MRVLMKAKLKTKAVFIIGAILLLTLAITIPIQLRAVSSEIRDALQIKTMILGDELTQEISKILSFGLTLEDIEDLPERCAGLVAEQEDLAFAMVVDGEGIILSHSEASFAGTPADAALLDPANPPLEVQKARITYQKEKVFTTLIPIIDNRQQYRGAVIIGLKGRVISRSLANLRWVSALAGLGTFLIILVLVMAFISRQITQPIDHLVMAAGAVGEGDLTQTMDAPSFDEIGELYQAFGNMLLNLRNLQERVAASFDEMERAIGELTEHTGTLQGVSKSQSGSVNEISTFLQHMNTQARNITSSMENLSRTSEETSSSIMEMMASIDEVAQNSSTLSGSVNETSSSMEEVIVSNREVAGNIEHLSQLIARTSTAVAQFDASIKEIQSLAQDSRQVAEQVRVNAEKEGSAAVQETIKEMNTIREAVTALSDSTSTLNVSVDNIGAILNVIDDVAEQTNLLALNAAIIAAQAGDHGRGFAVVADEIRELAERTSSSTKEISKVISGIQTETKKVHTLVRDGVDRVDRGVEAVGRTDKALGKIIESSEKSVEMSTHIARATAEQAAGSLEMSKSIQDVSERSSQISRATAEQGRGSESIIRSIEKMRDMAEQLRRATVEQKSGAKLIAKAGEGSSQLAQEVSKAAQEGSDTSARVVKEADRIARSAAETLEISTKMNDMVEKFHALSDQLKSTLSRFQT